MARSGRTERHAGSLEPDDYFVAGMELLAGGGINAITVASLCTALGVTKGSFYHHFRGIEDYRSHLLGYWANSRTQEVADAVGAVLDPVARIEMLRQFGVALPHEAETAIRAWSRTDAEAGGIRETVDRARERAVAQAYRDAGVPDDVADKLGRLLVAVLIGMQHRGATTDRDSLGEMFRFIADVAEALYLPRPDGGSA